LCLHFVLSLYWPLSSRFSRSCRDYLRQLPPFSFVLCLVVVWAFFSLLLAGTDYYFWSPPRGSSKYFISVVVLGKFGFKPIQTGFKPNRNRSVRFRFGKFWKKPNGLVLGLAILKNPKPSQTRFKPNQTAKMYSS